uniref:Uncharacterized protein n=1 Tax=Avena sativa TaxID=4498 RepID=A0ACD5U289_AVESA
MAPRRPTSTGRKKIEIRRLKTKEQRQVCFSKRRTGLFNKATELGVMCGVEVAAVTFSQGGKAFSYGHPSVESVLERFLPSNSTEEQDAAAAVGGAGAGEPNPALEELHRERSELRARLEAEKARKEAAEEAWAKAHADGIQAAVWMDAFVCQMGEEDLVAFKAALEMVDAAVEARAGRELQETLLRGHTLHGGDVDYMHQKRMLAPGFDAGQLLGRLTVHGGGGGFELGGTSGGMETMQQQQEQQVMMAMPPPPGFTAGLPMMPQQGLPQ